MIFQAHVAVTAQNGSDGEWEEPVTLHVVVPAIPTMSPPSVATLLLGLTQARTATQNQMLGEECASAGSLSLPGIATLTVKGYR